MACGNLIEELTALGRVWNIETTIIRKLHEESL